MKKSLLKSTMRSFMDEIWNQGDFENLETYISPKYEITKDPGDPWDGQVIDRHTFKQRVLYSRNAFPDLHFSIKKMIEEEDAIAVYWIMSGTHKGDLPQLPATGKPFSIAGITLYFFENKKIIGHIQAFDQLGFLAQIGRLSLTPQ